MARNSGGFKISGATGKLPSSSQSPLLHSEWSPLKVHMVKSYSLTPQKVAVFGDGVYKEVSTFK